MFFFSTIFTHSGPSMCIYVYMAEVIHYILIPMMPDFFFIVHFQYCKNFLADRHGPVFFLFCSLLIHKPDKHFDVYRSFFLMMRCVCVLECFWNMLYKALRYLKPQKKLEIEYSDHTIIIAITLYIYVDFLCLQCLRYF